MRRRQVPQRSAGPRALGFRGGLTVCVAVAVAACGSSGAPLSRTGAGDSARAATVVAEVSSTVETEPVPHDGDAADDAAVWVNPVDPAMSAIVATDKQGGLIVYDLDGEAVQYLPVGEVNNVDVRPAADGFTLDGRPVALVVAGNRSTNAIGVFVLDPDTRQLRDVADDAIRPDLEVYGSCIYHSAATGKLYAFVDSKEGEVEQWELTDAGSGRVGGQRVRSFQVESQVEGCVADHERGDFYLGEETRGIWKFGAEPDAGDSGALIASVSPSGPLVSDVEGLTLVHADGGAGYLIASSQGDDSYAMFRREGDNGYVGSFRIVAGRGIDGVEETDGIDVSTAPLGPSFPAGVFVAQDGKNDGAAQNYKLVPLQDVLPR
ncbi:phytase [Modestobacter sp. I12A-02662]|uniref:phytase n=1 Tax=Modestobacter sp. I12A-02662 TaxID=1730496 RepID=UPI0034DFC356